MSHPAGPPGSACLPPGRRLQTIKILKLWHVVLNDHILHRHPFAPTQAAATLIAQRIRYYEVFLRKKGTTDKSLQRIPILRQCINRGRRSPAGDHQHIFKPA